MTSESERSRGNILRQVYLGVCNVTTRPKRRGDEKQKRQETNDLTRGVSSLHATFDNKCSGLLLLVHQPRPHQKARINPPGAEIFIRQNALVQRDRRINPLD